MTNNRVVAEMVLPNGIALQLVLGDITQERVAAVVNAANERLQHGGGVAAAIANAGGPVIQRQSDLWVSQFGPISHRQPAITDAGEMPSQYVIHVVGPRWGEGQEAEKLLYAVSGALRLAEDKNCSSLALPAISTGIFGYPVAQAAEVILSAIVSFKSSLEEKVLEVVRLTLSDETTLQSFQAQLNKLDPTDQESE